MKQAIVLCFVFFSGTALAQSYDSHESDRLFRFAGGMVWASQIGDIVSTEAAIFNGGSESNPIWRNHNVRRYAGYPLKLGFAYAANEATAYLYRNDRRKVAMITRFAVAAFGSWMTTRNFQIAISIK